MLYDRNRGSHTHTHTHTHSSSSLCVRVCTWGQQSLRAAEHEQQCGSSKQPKGGQVVLFSALFPPLLPLHLFTRLNIHKHVNWRTVALISARPREREIRLWEGERPGARSLQLSTTWGHLSFLLPPPPGGSPGIQAIYGPQRSSFETGREEKREADFCLDDWIDCKWEISGEASAAAVSARWRRRERKGPIKSTKC